MRDLASGHRGPSVRQRFLATIGLLVLAVLFWKFRIFDSGVNPALEVGPVDLYIQATPMNLYGFEALRHGHLPAWNPYQLCGEPFLAAAYVGLFYPPHWINLFVDVLTSLEITYVLHLFFGGLSMWWLCRHFGLTVLGGVSAALTFMWSWWSVAYNIQPGIFEQMMWMPLTVLLLDRVLSGRRLAWLWWAVAVACQLALGAIEILLHAMYLAALLALCRLVQLALGDGWRVALRRGGAAALGSVAGVLLAAPLLLPVLELVRQSTRAVGALSWAEVAWPAVPPLQLFQQMAAVKDAGSTGVLAIFGLALAIGYRRYRLVWLFAALALVFGASLVGGGTVYRWYYSVPVVGSLFRRPWKFLDIYCFAVALLVGLALTRLEEWETLPRRALWTRPRWWLLLGVGIAWLGWLFETNQVMWFSVATAALFLVFGAVGDARLRTLAVTGLCVVQGASLFFTGGDTHVRPVKRPEIFRVHQSLFDALKPNLGDARVYLSGKFLFWPNLTAKQGLLTKTPVVNDYDPLALRRYRMFFETISPRFTTSAPFAGLYDLLPTSRWGLMNLTGTKYFVMLRGEPGEVFMSQDRGQFHRIYEKGNVRAYEKQQVLPRAYFASRARALDDPNAVLAALDDPGFDPRSEVILEGEQVPATPPAPAAGAAGVRITRYEPEDVEIAVDTPEPGYMVLTDLWYPGWRAYVGDREVPIERANYLFRAVRLGPGHSVVHFHFRPASLRLGLALSATTALLLLIAALWTRRNAGLSDLH